MLRAIRTSLALKILATIAGSTGALLLLTGWQSARRHDKAMIELQSQVNGTFSSFVYGTLLSSMAEGRMGDLQRALQNAVRATSFEFLRVVTPDGVIRYSGRSDEVGQRLSDRRLQELVRKGATASGALEGRWDGRVISAIPLQNQGYCSAAECHHHSKDGPYLGAVLMEFDFSAFEKELLSLKHREPVFLVGEMVLVMGVVALCLQFLVIKPLSRVVDGAKRIAQGDLSRPVEVVGSDEMGRLAGHINTLHAYLRESVEESAAVADALAQVVDELDRSSEGLVAISMEQTSGAAQQASAVQEATTTSEQIAATSNEISANVESVENVAEETYAACVQGGEDVRDAVQGMREVKVKVNAIADSMLELGKKSRKIGGVAEIIDEISEQTHLLALNAAIEAAGAGEHGKRFSVVAAEIRRLAERTVEATGQIKELIQEIQGSTNDTVLATEKGIAIALSGATRVDKIGESLATILSLVRNTRESAKEITVATQQQATAGEQLVLTITDINDVAVQVNRSAEQVEKAVVRLKELARKLKGLVEQNRHAQKFLV